MPDSGQAGGAPGSGVAPDEGGAHGSGVAPDAGGATGLSGAGDPALPVARGPGLAGLTRHRGIALLGIALVAGFAVALVAAIITSQGSTRSVPGTDTIASLGVMPAGYLVGTTGGLAVSPDAKTWSVARLPSELVAVASNATTGFVLDGGVLRSTADLRAYTTMTAGVAGTVMAATPSGGVVIVSGHHIRQVDQAGTVTVTTGGSTMPQGLLGLAVDPQDASTMLAGGPIAGLWETRDGGATWFQVLRTPTQAVLFDPANPQRILIGTDAAALISTDGGRQWQFTGLRDDIHGLAAEGGKIYAVDAGRELFVSTNGMAGWTTLNG